MFGIFHRPLPLAKAFQLALAFLFLGVGTAPAQDNGCERLKAQIASLSRSGNPSQAAKFSAAAQKQRAELDRTSAYANSIGCSNRKFLIFGSSPPAQCAGVEDQIARMRANLGQLQAQAGAAGGGNEITIRDLTYRYNAQCRAPQPQQARAPNLLESLFGTPRPPQFEQIPLDPGPEKPSAREPEEAEDAPRRGGSRAVCVRTCDGGFFPVSYSARRGSLDNLEDMCRALCPNTEAKLFTFAAGADIETAVSPDGDAYTDLPNALKFQRSFDPTCSCKAKSQSWVEALAEAERILGQSKGTDILVTPQKAEELSRPNQPARGKKPKVTGTPVADVVPAKLPVPEIDSASVASTPDAKPTLEDSGYREVIGADGIKRRVRIVGPKL